MEVNQSTIIHHHPEVPYLKRDSTLTMVSTESPQTRRSSSRRLSAGSAEQLLWKQLAQQAGASSTYSENSVRSANLLNSQASAAHPMLLKIMDSYFWGSAHEMQPSGRRWGSKKADAPITYRAFVADCAFAVMESRMDRMWSGPSRSTASPMREGRMSCPGIAGSDILGKWTTRSLDVVDLMDELWEIGLSPESFGRAHTKLRVEDTRCSNPGVGVSGDLKNVKVEPGSSRNSRELRADPLLEAMDSHFWYNGREASASASSCVGKQGAKRSDVPVPITYEEFVANCAFEEMELKMDRLWSGTTQPPPRRERGRRMSNQPVPDHEILARWRMGHVDVVNLMDELWESSPLPSRTQTTYYNI